MGSRLTLNRDAAGLLGKAPLSTLFWFLSIGAYAYHSRKPGARRFTAVIALLVLSLSSKSVFVTAPLFFLLLDLWPLKRWNKTEGVAEIPQMDMGKLMIEKIPMVAIVVVISFVTIFARQEIGALSTADRLGLNIRLANAAISYSGYLLKAVWPIDVTIIYLHWGSDISVGLAALSFGLPAPQFRLRAFEVHARPFVARS